jgi:Outer membrane protein beta-barrel domain
MESCLSKSTFILMRTKRTAATLWMQQNCKHNHSKTVRRLAGLCSLILVSLACVSAGAQTSPRIQVFGGYSYLRFDSPTLGFANATGLNGFTVMAAFNLTRGFGAVAQASGDYGSHLSVKDFAFGPQFLWPRGRLLFFAHGLYGRARGRDTVGTTMTDTGNTFEGGGGVDYEITHRFSIRVIQADYTYTKFFQQRQNNIRLSTGLVFHLGALKRKSHRAPSEPVP